MIARTLALLVGLIVATSAGAQTPPAPLVLEAKIPLGSISGRIDHLAIDLRRQWLSVAELGNDSVGVIDVANRKLISTIRGFQEPQGIGYEPSTDTLYVANAGDGSVRVLRADDLSLLGRVDLGDDLRVRGRGLSQQDRMRLRRIFRVKFNRHSEVADIVVEEILAGRVWRPIARDPDRIAEAGER